MSKTDKQLDLQLFDQLLSFLRTKYSITDLEIIKIIEFCFGEGNIPSIPDFENKNNHFHKFVSKVLDINKKELIKAFNRTIPKLKELDILSQLRKENRNYSPRWLPVEKDEFGVYREIILKGEENAPIL